MAACGGGRVGAVGSETRRAVRASKQSPCSGRDTQIVSVSTPNGSTSGLEDLKGTHFSPGDTYTAKADVGLELGDGSLVG